MDNRRNQRKKIIFCLIGMLGGVLFFSGDKPDTAVNLINITEKNNELYFNNKVPIDKYMIYINQKRIKIKNNAIDKNKVMINPPNKLNDVKINENKDGIIIEYKEPIKSESINTIKIEGYYNEEKIAESKKYNIKQKNKIINSVICINGKEYSLSNNQFIDYSNFQKGENEIKIKNFDEYNNESTNTLKYEYKKIDIKQENNQVKYNKEKEYKYYLIDNNNNKKIELNNGNIDLNNIFTNIIVNSPYDLNSQIDNLSINISWNSDKAINNYQYYIEGIKDNKKIYSDINNYSAINNIKGYYYHLGLESTYEITQRDNYTEDKEITNKVSQYGRYYFYIKAVDNNGNLSEQKQIAINCNSPIPTDNKMNTILSFVSRDSAVNDTQYYKVLNTIYNYIPNNIINLLKNNNIKINITNIDLRDILFNLTGEIETTHMQGVFLPELNQLYIGGDYPDAIIHEIGHAVDDYLDWKSCESDFESSYNERYNINISTHCSSNNLEYFAEAFYIYFFNPDYLKNNASNTYFYINNVINNI